MAEHRVRYELIERIGVGGMAEVFKARVLGAAGFAKTVAVKRILDVLSTDAEFIGRFVDEASLTARLQHPNVCQVLDFGLMGGSHFIAMELVEGLDLARVLASLEEQGRRLPLEAALEIVIGVVRGLDHAHRATDDEGRRLGIVHRDVSPQNVLLSVIGDVKLSDFGAAKARSDLRRARTVENATIGKLLYMAPEQRMGRAVDARTDLHGAGVLLAEMLLGPRLFRARLEAGLPDYRNLLAPIEEALPGEGGARLARVVARATDPNPERRYPKASLMLADLEACAAAVPLGVGRSVLAALIEDLMGEARPSRPPTAAAKEAAPRRRDEATTEHSPLAEPASVSFSSLSREVRDNLLAAAARRSPARVEPRASEEECLEERHPLYGQPRASLADSDVPTRAVPQGPGSGAILLPGDDGGDDDDEETWALCCGGEDDLPTRERPPSAAPTPSKPHSGELPGAGVRYWPTRSEPPRRVAPRRVAPAPAPPPVPEPSVAAARAEAAPPRAEAPPRGLPRPKPRLRIEASSDGLGPRERATLEERLPWLAGPEDARAEAFALAGAGEGSTPLFCLQAGRQRARRRERPGLLAALFLAVAFIAAVALTVGFLSLAAGAPRQATLTSVGTSQALAGDDAEVALPAD